MLCACANGGKMATTDELKTVLRETLESRGVLGQLKAQIRAEVYKAFRDDQRAEVKPQLSDENLMIDELIKEYLQFNGYNYTHSVFVTETGQPKEQLSTEFIAQELSLHRSPDDTSIPLLYQMLAHFKGSGSKPHPPADDHSAMNPAPSTEPHHQGNLSSTNETGHRPPTVVIRGLK